MKKQISIIFIFTTLLACNNMFAAALRESSEAINWGFDQYGYRYRTSCVHGSDPLWKAVQNNELEAIKTHSLEAIANNTYGTVNDTPLMVAALAGY